MKIKFLTLLLSVLLLLLTGCGEVKTVTCDGCGKAVEIEADSKMDDSWIIYCDTCYTEFFGEEGLIS